MKNYLVTGASSGIGKAITLRLSQEHRIIAIARNEQKLEELRKENENIVPLSFDLQNLEDIGMIFLFCLEKGIKLDGLIHSAGLTMSVPIGSTDIGEMNEVLTVNCMAFAGLMKYFSKKKYSNNGASVVAISSSASYVHTKGTSIYAGSKSAVNSMVKVMAKELIKRKIRVNSVAPGFVDTEMTQSLYHSMENASEIVMEDQPWGMLSPDDVTDAVMFLLSEQAKMITGIILPVTAGRIL